MVPNIFQIEFIEFSIEDILAQAFTPSQRAASRKDFTLRNRSSKKVLISIIQNLKIKVEGIKNIRGSIIVRRCPKAIVKINKTVFNLTLLYAHPHLVI